MNPRRLSCLIAACIVCFICSTAGYAQQCYPPTAPPGEMSLPLATAWQYNLPHPPLPFWGVRVATVNYYKNAANPPTPEIVAILEDAVLQWNLRACDTGIFFMAVPGLADLDFWRTPFDSLAGDCAAYQVPGQDIVYGPAWEARITNPALGPIQARAVIIHEIGHFLGLDESNFPLPINIMTQGTCATPAPVTNITIAGAQKVAECLNSQHNCNFWLFFPLHPDVCIQQGGYWNFSIGGCYPEPQPVPCVDCLDNDDCCYGDVCHNGQCGPPEINCPDCCPECPYDTVCYEGFCSYATPVLIDVNGDGFQLTDAAHGVDFDFAGNGAPRHIAWTAAGTDDAWLVWDKNRNGKIDSAREMFGNLSPQPTVPQEDRNGFLALAEFDKSTLGGNSDGVISRQDYFFRDLRLWTDSNHNGISEAAELRSLEPSGLAVLELRYKESRRRDQYGNWFRYRAKVKDARGAQIGRWAWDVILKLGN